MGASFRSAAQIEGLAGCDYLTISPAILQELQEDNGELTQQLVTDNAQSYKAQHVEQLTEEDFRWQHNSDAAGVFLLADGIRRFAADLEKLEDLIKSHL